MKYPSCLSLAVLVAVAVAGCSSTTTTADGGANADGGTTPTEGGTPPSDASAPLPDGSPPGDGGGGGGCAALQASGQPYVCFTLSGGGSPGYEVAYPRVAPAAFQVYFNLTEQRSFFRMNGAPKVNGSDELVNVDFTVVGKAPVSEAWRTDIGGGGSGPVIVFFGPDITSGDQRRTFRPIDGSTDLGTTVITRYGAVGELVEGTFSGIGKLDQLRPTQTTFDRVNLTGSFRVTRVADR